MINRFRHILMVLTIRLLSALTLLLLLSSALQAQSVDTIRPNSKAVELRRVWSVAGRSGDYLAQSFYRLANLIHPEQSAWFIWGRRDAEDRGLYTWNSSSQTVQMIQRIPIGAYAGCTGRFFGGDSIFVVMTHGRQLDSIPVNIPRLQLYGVKADTIDLTLLSAWDGESMNPMETTTIEHLRVADLDQDGADELLVFLPGSVWPIRDSTGQLLRYESDGRPRFWIFKGGPTFSLDTPSVVPMESLSLAPNAAPVRMVVGRMDNDALPDVATVFEYRIDGHDSTLMSLWLSSEQDVWDWNQPHRRISFPDAHTTHLAKTLQLLDTDGDSLLDCLYPLEPFSGGQHALFLSHQGSFLQRTDPPGALRADRADRILVNTPFDGAVNLGYISDSSEHYAALGFLRQGNYVVLSGGPNGPDAQWDATVEGVIGSWIPIGDATGDGWEDLLVGYPFAAGDAGYAALYAGGPYIPHDSTVGVEWFPVAGEKNQWALAVWPQPARDELHIAWRGDLTHTPRSFRVHDVSGALVAEGRVPPGRGEGIWRCAERSAGVYTLTTYDGTGVPLGTARIVIQR